jgi:molybdenum cofactor synthesis domain-containing protein
MAPFPTPTDIRSATELGSGPPTAAALVVGDELLSGKVREANVEVLARALRELGVLMRRVVIVMDDVNVIAEEVRSLSCGHDWLFTSGGIGPTHDDLTIEGAARAFGVPVVTSSVLADRLRKHYGSECTEAHLRMALVPSGAALESVSDAHWPAIRLNRTWLLPGVPEAFRMKIPAIMARVRLATPACPFVSHAVHVRLDEGRLKPMIDSVVSRFRDVAIGSYPRWVEDGALTKLTFDGLDETRVIEARDALVDVLPPGEIDAVE